MNPLLRQNSILTARESGRRGEEDADYFLKLEIDLLGIEKKNTFLYNNIGILEKLLFRNAKYIRE